MLSRRLICLMCLVLITALAGETVAAPPVVVWTDGDGDHLWSTADNWDTLVLPTAADKAKIGKLPGPTITQPGAVAYNVPVADGSSTGALTVDGGTLTTTTWLILAYGAGSNGTVNMNSGTVNVGNNLYVGFDGAGTFNMNGGTITVNGRFTIARNSSSAVGHVNLDGGTISTATFSMRDNGGIGTMDITAGTLIINGDVRSTVQSYINNVWITAYEGTGTINMDYDDTNSGKTTLTATENPPAPPGQATNPSPADEAEDQSIYASIIWTADAGAKSHDVYFGTDSTPDATEFQGNQTATIFNSGTLANSTTYYWRIDEIGPGGTTTGVVWSFTTEVTTTIKLWDDDSADHLWSAPANWDPDAVPDATDNVRIDIADAIVSVSDPNAICYTMQMQSPGGQLDVNETLRGELVIDNSAYLDNGLVRADTVIMDINNLLDVSRGELILDGDHAPQITGYIDNGLVTAYGGDSSVGIPIVDFDDAANQSRLAALAKAGCPYLTQSGCVQVTDFSLDVQIEPVADVTRAFVLLSKGAGYHTGSASISQNADEVLVKGYLSTTNNIDRKTFAHRANDEYNEYAYDDLDRLIDVDYLVDNSTPDHEETFVMDTLGNRTGDQTLTDGTVNFTVQSSTNRYTSVGGNAITHDDAGNMTTDKDDYTYEYDYENRIVKIEDSSSNDVAEYAYDALGRRIRVIDSKASATTLYYYNPEWQVLAEYNGSNELQRYYVYGNYIDEPLVMSDGTDDYYYVQDHLYSTVALIGYVDPAWVVVERYEYDAYGTATIFTDMTDWQDESPTTASKSAFGNPYMFTGRRLDVLDNDNLLTMHYRHRTYDTYTGRFLQPDPLEYIDGLSLYEYVKNNPLVGLDPEGEALWYCSVGVSFGLPGRHGYIWDDSYIQADDDLNITGIGQSCAMSGSWGQEILGGKDPSGFPDGSRNGPPATDLDGEWTGDDGKGNTATCTRLANSDAKADCVMNWCKHHINDWPIWIPYLHDCHNGVQDAFKACKLDMVDEKGRRIPTPRF